MKEIQDKLSQRYVRIIHSDRTRMVGLLVGLLIFGTGCNWFSASNPFGGRDEDAASVESPQVDPTAAVSSGPDGDGADDRTAINEDIPEAAVEATAEAATVAAAEVAVEATADAIVAELQDVQDGLSNNRAAVPLTVGKALAATGVNRSAEALSASGEVASSSVPTQFGQGTVQDDLVNIRSGPDTQYAIIGQVNLGASLTIVGRSEAGDWWQVCCPAPDQAEGWIFAELLTVPPALAENPQSVPVAEAPALPVAEPIGGPAGSGNVVLAASAPGLPGNGGFGPSGGSNPLTGGALPPGRNNQRPVVVCINNDFAARPQFGTSQADVMYEYLMEGYGITRFSGVYYGEDSAQIGPIRSARLINYYLEALYDAGLACSGASDGVRYILKHESPFPYLDVDLDDPSNSRYTTNVGSDYRTRLRTDTAKLSRWLAEWGAQKPAAIRGFTFGGLVGGSTPATTIDIPYPGASRSGYNYDGNSGKYARSLGGSPHLDGNSGAQVAVENVIIQYVPHETTDIVEDSLGSLSIRLDLFGSGRAVVMRDGQAFDGTWQSGSGGDTPRFFTSGGEEIPLKPGRTWISIVPLSYTVNYR